jgi:hypothetical protein
MGWWARRVQVAAARARSAAEDRWADVDVDEAIVAAFARRTVTARWTVDVRHGHRVMDAEGQPLFTLRSGDVRAADGACLCTVQQPLSSALLLQHGPGPLLVRHFPTSPLVARMGSAPRGPVTAELLPPDGVDVRYRDLTWARATRSRGPFTYNFEAVADGEAAGQLVDAAGVGLLSDHRRYVRASDGSTGVLREWVLQLIDNPLPDAWLLGILLGTRLLATPPPTRRTSL